MAGSIGRNGGYLLVRYWSDDREATCAVGRKPGATRDHLEPERRVELLTYALRARPGHWGVEASDQRKRAAIRGTSNLTLVPCRFVLWLAQGRYWSGTSVGVANVEARTGCWSSARITGRVGALLSHEDAP